MDSRPALQSSQILTLENMLRKQEDRVRELEELVDKLTGYISNNGAHPEIIASFETENDYMTGSTGAPVKRVEIHDDGVIEVVIDYWPMDMRIGLK